MLDERFIPINQTLAKYNLQKNLDEKQNWYLEDSSSDPRIPDNVTHWRSPYHSVIMLRKTIGDKGVEYWECNAHFFEQCLQYPERQNGKNGIFTHLPNLKKE